MLLLITNALIETLTKHMFKKYLDEQDKVQIGGAPSWYMKPIDDKMCTFAHKKGSYESVDIAKNDAKMKMIKKIDGTIEVVIHENTKKITNEKEKAVVEKFKVDTNLPLFVRQNINYSRVVYEDEVHTTFVRACIPNSNILEYQKERLTKIKKAVLKQKSKNAFGELDMDMKGQKSNDPNDPFSELE
jgi:hypothetical protein